MDLFTDPRTFRTDTRYQVDFPEDDAFHDESENEDNYGVAILSVENQDDDDADALCDATNGMGIDDDDGGVSLKGIAEDQPDGFSRCDDYIALEQRRLDEVIRINEQKDAELRRARTAQGKVYDPRIQRLLVDGKLIDITFADVDVRFQHPNKFASSVDANLEKNEPGKSHWQLPSGRPSSSEVDPYFGTPVCHEDDITAFELGEPAKALTENECILYSPQPVTLTDLFNQYGERFFHIWKRERYIYRDGAPAPPPPTPFFGPASPEGVFSMYAPARPSAPDGTCIFVSTCEDRGPYIIGFEPRINFSPVEKCTDAEMKSVIHAAGGNTEMFAGYSFTIVTLWDSDSFGSGSGRDEDNDDDNNHSPNTAKDGRNPDSDPSTDSSNGSEGRSSDSFDRDEYVFVDLPTDSLHHAQDTTTTEPTRSKKLRDGAFSKMDENKSALSPTKHYWEHTDLTIRRAELVCLLEPVFHEDAKEKADLLWMSEIVLGYAGIVCKKGVLQRTLNEKGKRVQHPAGEACEKILDWWQIEKIAYFLFRVLDEEKWDAAAMREFRKMEREIKQFFGKFVVKKANAENGTQVDPSIMTSSALADNFEAFILKHEIKDLKKKKNTPFLLHESDQDSDWWEDDEHADTGAITSVHDDPAYYYHRAF